MRNLPPLFKAAISEGTSSLARVWSVTRRDNVVYRFTDHDRNITIGANTYLCTDSFTMSDITHAISGGAQSATMSVFLGDNPATHFTYNDLKDKLFNNSKLKVDVVIWSNPALGIANIFNGEFNSIELDVIKKRATIDITGNLSKGIPSVGEKYSAECRADLGDNRCKVVLSSFSATGTVINATNKRKFEVQLTPNPNNYEFSVGKLTWNTGLNIGLRQEVLTQYGLSSTNDLLITAFYANKDIVAGDTFTITKGCDFRPTTCFTRFNNIINFRGEPFVPGPDYISDKAEPI